MSTSRLLTQEFEYFAPHTLKEALDLLYKYKDEEVKILAGGTDLLVKMKTLDMKVDYLINIKEIPELKAVETNNQGLKIGATVPLSQLERREIIKEKYPALYEGIKSMAAIAIRNMATLPGNICNASPAGDTIPPLMVYEAQLRIESKEGERLVPVEDFLRGVGETIIRKEELVSQVIIPAPSQNSGSAFSKKSRVKADIAKINLAIWLEREGKTCKDARIVLGSVFIKALRAKRAEGLLKGEMVSKELLTQVARQAAEEIKPIDDVRSTAEYRTTLARVMVEDTLKLAWERAGGELEG